MKYRGLILSTRLLLVLVNILIAAVVFYFFLKKSHHALYELTAHGDEYVVSNYENAKLEEAIMAGSLQGLQFVVVDSVYDPSYPKGVIIKQNPSPGSRVKRNRKIYVNITTASVPIREVDFGDFDHMERHFKEYPIIIRCRCFRLIRCSSRSVLPQGLHRKSLS